MNAPSSDQMNEGAATPAPIDEGLGRFIDALAVALASRDHAADLTARQTSQDRADDGQRHDEKR